MVRTEAPVLYRNPGDFFWFLKGLEMGGFKQAHLVLRPGEASRPGVACTLKSTLAFSFLDGNLVKWLSPRIPSFSLESGPMALPVSLPSSPLLLTQGSRAGC